MKSSDVLGCAGVTLFLLLTSQLIPLAGLLSGLLLPLPFLYYSVKLGRAEGAKVALATFLVLFLITILAGFVRAMFLCAEFGLLGLVLAELYRQKKDIGAVVFWGTVSLVVVGFGFLFVIGLSRHTGPLSLVLDYFRSNLHTSTQGYEQLGLSAESVAKMQNYSRVLNRIIERIYPALVVVGSAIVVWVNVLVSMRLLRARGLSGPEFSPLDRWQAPEKLIWGGIAAGFAFFLPWEGVSFWAVNTLVVLAAVYGFQGLSILQFFLNKARISRPFRMAAYVLILIQQYLLAAMALVGLFDQWFDFRKIGGTTVGTED